MKKITLILAVVLSFTYTYGANQKVYQKTNKIDSIYVLEKEPDEAFDFDHKAYLPVGFNPSKELNNLFLYKIPWIDDMEDEAFDFDHTAYLPVGFNPKKELNHLFLNDIPWIEEDESNVSFDFDTMYYFKKHLNNKI